MVFLNKRLSFLFFTLIFLSFRSSYCFERPIVVLITSYNNVDWYQRNLDHVFSQDYSNYRVIYIDDCSPDGTGDLVEQYIAERGLEDKIILIKNEERMFKMYNLVFAVHNLCDDDEIILDHDGDDWFSRNDALSIINAAYEGPNVWMTYGNWGGYPKPEVSNCKEIPAYVIRNSSYRDYWWVTSQQRTFYAWLFKKIKIEDLYYNGDFVKADIDTAYMFPLLEMSGGKFKFIRDIIYIYNRACVNTVDENDVRKQLLREESRFNRARARYSKLRAAPVF